jgi:tRNA uridine 5-carboxymethylaminomethyl modification enzyme
LSSFGTVLGMYDEPERAMIDARLVAEDDARRIAESTSITPEMAAPVLAAAGSRPLPHAVRIAEVARRQAVSLVELFHVAGVGRDLPVDAVVSTELELKYAGYFDRERQQAEKLRRMADFPLDLSLPYEQMLSLSLEARQKLLARRPRTLAQASAMPGVSRTDLQNLVIEIEKHRRQGAIAPAGG